VNGVTGLRPTYGRISRHGAMALSWTMDKIGPMCRSVEDCVLVFNAIYGPDGRDGTVVEAPFVWNPDVPLSKLKIGFIKSQFEPPQNDGRGGRGDGRGGDGRGRGGLTPEQQQARLKLLNDALDVYRKAGATLHPMEIPEAAAKYSSAAGWLLSTEAAAAFDDLTRSAGIKDESLGSWPGTFRVHRFVPAVEYIRAQRVRTLLIREMDKLMSEYDVFISPSTGGNSLGITNLTGHPAVALRAGFVGKMPVEIMITGRLYDESTILRVALAYERATTWNETKPELTV
jgi:Asp-tRNA(Asn)/Glu-tRNA(Gln) amidotransferase A subunit family amidase